MYIEQMYTDCLAEAAYYIESEGEVAIIDPLRETSPYLEKAKDRGAKIKFIFETHFHADFVSGHVDLSKATGAPIIFGPTAETGYESYSAKDNEEFKLGNLTLKILHTPGHTPESTTFLLKDSNGKDHAIFSGDTLFIGDVGRPDLAIKGKLTKNDLAGNLYDSLRSRIMPLADDVLVYPAHGAGSACGKNMSSETFSTLGEQKQNNYALRDISKEQFIKEVTTGILPPPIYFPKNAMLNKGGYDPIDQVVGKASSPFSVAALKAEMDKGAVLIDTRDEMTFAEGYIPKSIFIGLNGSYAVWAASLILDLHTPILLVTNKGSEAEAAIRLARVGFDNIIGYLEGGISAWGKAGGELEKIASVDPTDKILSDGEPKIFDVRKPAEFKTNHVNGAQSKPLDFVWNWIEDLSPNETYHLYCQGGYRSVITSSILKRKGFNNIVNILGGYDSLVHTDLQMVAEPEELIL